MSFCFISSRLSRTVFYVSIHLTLHKLLVLFLAGKMDSKNKNRIYKKIIEEICKKYDDGKEFFDNRIKELCFQDGILINEVSTWFKANLFLHQK